MMGGCRMTMCAIVGDAGDAGIMTEARQLHCELVDELTAIRAIIAEMDNVVTALCLRVTALEVRTVGGQDGA